MPSASKRRLTSLFQVAVDQRLAPHEHDPAGDGQVGPERDRRGTVAATRVQPDRADDRAHHGGQQDDRQDALEPAPGAQGRQQLEIAVAHAFLAGELLEQPPHRPQRQIAGQRPQQGGLGGHIEIVAGRDQAQPHQGQGQLVGQQLGPQVDPGQRHQEAAQHNRTETLPAEPELPDAGGHQHRGQQLHQRVLDRDRGMAMPTLAAQGQPAEQRNVLVPGQLVLAVRAVRGLHHDARWWRLIDVRLFQHLARIALPLPLQPLGQAQDHHVEETADQQSQSDRGGVAETGMLVEKCH